MTGSATLTVQVAGQELALPLGEIGEVLRPRPWTRIPNAPPGLLGLTNLRGTPLPVVCLASLLGAPAPARSPGQRIVVTGGTGDGAPVGLLVDAVTALAPGGEARLLDVAALLAPIVAAPRAPVRQDPARPDRAAADARSAGEADEGTVALLALLVAGQEYALALDQVGAVLPLRAATALPGMDGAMLGVMPWRDAPLPLVSLAALLGMPPDSGDKQRIAVVSLGGMAVGVVASGLDRILRLPRRAIRPVPPVLTRGRGEPRLTGICHDPATQRLLGLLAPDGLFDEETTRRIHAHAHAHAHAEPMPDRAAPAALRRQASAPFVIFVIAGERFGLPVAAVDEVVARPAAITRVPFAPPFVLGVTNLRGQAVPVIDQASRFAAGTDGGTRAASGRRLVVVSIGGLRAGLAVDEVVAISKLDTDPICSTARAAAFDRVAVDGEREEMTLLIDPATLLDQTERDILAAIAAPALPHADEAA